MGLGKSLVTGALELARSRGCSTVYLSAESWNFTAHAFYRSLGFLEKTVIHFEYELGASPA
jgi:ribosomal protein S18 acetylase RimI-like enzyme